MASTSASSTVLGPHLVSTATGAVTAAATDTFDIEDFTAASEWEKFESALQQIIRDWGLNRSVIAGVCLGNPEKINVFLRNSSTSGIPTDRSKGGRKCRWTTERKTVSFYDFDFSVTRHELVERTDDDGRRRPRFTSRVRISSCRPSSGTQQALARQRRKDEGAENQLERCSESSREEEAEHILPLVPPLCLAGACLQAS